jgi:enoyl-CoA hydratase/carnithine racemase
LADIIASVKDNIGSIVLNRPELHNAISQSMWENLPGALSEIHGNGAKVVIIEGSGSAFASGADLSELGKIDSYEDASKLWQAIAGCLNYLSDFDLPVVAKIDGSCLGGGCLLAVACDLRFASEVSTFAIPIAKLGIVLDDSNVARLTNLVGPAIAKEMLMTGRTISSTRAEAIGLINQSCPQPELAGIVSSIAGKIADNAQISIFSAKASVNKTLHLPQPTFDDKAVISSYISDEFRKRIKGGR